VSGALFPPVSGYSSGSVLPILRPAYFRGVRFYVEEAGGEHGRRHADHEYAGRNRPYAEDLGRRQRTWPITGYVIGPYFRIERNALIAACEDLGVGELVHPAIGVLLVVCRRFSWSEQREARGRAVFTLEFAEAGEIQEPSSEPNAQMLLEASADELGRASNDSFTGATPGGGTTNPNTRSYAAQAALSSVPSGAFDVTHSLNYVVSYAQTDVQVMAKTLEIARMPSRNYPQAPVAEAIASLFNDGPGLVFDPPALATMTADAFSAFADSGEPDLVASALLEIANTYEAGAKSTDVGTTTFTYIPQYPASTRLAINQAAWQAFCRQCALREVGYLAPALTVESYEQGIKLATRVNEAFDAAEQAASVNNRDEVFAALIGLRARITTDIESRNASTAPLTPYKTLRSQNAITLAWRLYQDVDRNIELVEATQAYTPCFLPTSGMVKPV
jgi:DNA circularisation protein N-terminus